MLLADDSGKRRGAEEASRGSRFRYNRGAVRLFLILVTVLIVYGTLYPFQFDFDRNFENPGFVLLHSWPEHFDRFAFRDALTNVLLYLPLGFAATAVFGRRWWAVVPAAAALSASLEMLQIYESIRMCSLADLVFNTVGAAIGAAIAMVAPQRYLPRMLDRSRVGPAMVAACWLGYLLYPFLPILSRGHLHGSWARFLSARFSLAELGMSTAEWFAMVLLLEAISGRARARWMTALLMLTFPLRLLLADRALSPAEVAGAAIAIVLSLAIPLGRRPAAGALLMAVAILLRELAPFDFSAQPHPFSWIPFSATLVSERVPAAVVILRKAFDYGAMVWLARDVGLIRAGCLVAAVLLAAEWIQRYLPGRQPEITDAVLALVMTGVLAWRWRR